MPKDVPEKLGEMHRKEKQEIALSRLNALEAKLEKQHPKILEAYKQTPPRHQRLFLEVNVKGGQKTKSIKLKCLQCQSFCRYQIRNCTERQCGLWKFRPYQ